MNENSAPRQPVVSAAVARVIFMAIAGGIVAAIVGISWSWWYAAACGWSAAAAGYCFVVWRHIWPMNPSETRTHARQEDPGVVVGEALVVFASIASFAAVAIIMLRARNDQGPLQIIVAALTVLSIALSWFLIHTLYTLRYAREYYSDPEGGIEFQDVEDDPPQYSDFAYLAFDLGMTYQVSDTNLRSKRFRKLVLRHSMLSYLFGTCVLAATINLVSGL